MSSGANRDILIGPRTTVYALLQAYPFLESLLRRRMTGFEKLVDERARTRWARIMTLGDIAVKLELPWQQMMGAVAAEVERETGRAPRAADAPRRIAGDERRLGELRGIVADLEAGRPLPEMATRWQEVTADLEQAEAAALEAALLAEASARGAGTLAAAAAEAAGDLPPPPGHPLDLLRREAERVKEVCAALAAELERLGGSPARRRWQRARPLVAHLVDRLATVELRFRREQQAWFPALRVYGVEGPQRLLAVRQQEALETLRRMRLAVERDDAAYAIEGGTRVLGELEELLALDGRLLEPLARRHFSAADWAAVRELEDGVGWALAGEPPPWPQP